jgi:hypothetical protein
MLKAYAKASAQASLSRGFTMKAPSMWSAAPANLDNTRLPEAAVAGDEWIALPLWQATYSEHTRFMPSRVLEIKQMSAAVYKAVSSSGSMKAYRNWTGT